MATVTLAELRPGAVLAAPVNGPGGRELAPAGIALTDRHLQALKAWGIASVELASAAPAVDERVLLAARRTVAPRFRGQPTDHPAIRALFAAAVARQMKAPP